MAYMCQQIDSNFNVKSELVGKFLFYATKTPFEFVYTHEGDIVGIRFKGCYVPTRESMNFLANAAAYVTDGSFIEMKGEQGEYWRYVFKGGKLKELNPKTVTIWEE